MRVIVLALLGLMTLLSAAHGRQMVISVDDLPWVEFSQSTKPEVQARHQRLLEALRGTPAIGFVNEKKLIDDSRLSLWRQQMLVDWLDAGFDLGNHTYDHVDLHRVSAAQFERSIVLGERYLRPLLESRGKSLRWFRHPYLHTGMDAQTRDRIVGFLEQHDYAVAPVTIDNGEWIYARAYLSLLKLGDRQQQRKLRAQYVDYMLSKVVFFEDAAQRQFERELPQILLIHANALNADALPDLLTVLRIRGYDFISMAEAVQDPAYAHDDQFFGRSGITWLHRWALTDKMPSSHYANEPTVSEWVMELAGVDGE